MKLILKDTKKIKIGRNFLHYNKNLLYTYFHTRVGNRKKGKGYISTSVVQSPKHVLSPHVKYMNMHYIISGIPKHGYTHITKQTFVVINNVKTVTPVFLVFLVLIIIIFTKYNLPNLSTNINLSPQSIRQCISKNSDSIINNSNAIVNTALFANRLNLIFRSEILTLKCITDIHFRVSKNETHSQKCNKRKRKRNSTTPTTGIYYIEYSLRLIIKHNYHYILVFSLAPPSTKLV